MPFVSYAQNFEDVMLWRALGHVRNGFFIDVGAWSPEQHSVTLAFSQRGWRGINIEPNAHYHAQLVERRPLDVNLRVAVGERCGRVCMRFVEDTGLSTAVAEIAETHKASGWTVQEEEVELTTLQALWRDHVPAGQPVHFLKVDVEGFEQAVLAGNDWQRHRPWVLVVEATRPLSRVESHAAWEPVLHDAGYMHCYADGLNRYYVAQEHAELAKAFAYPPCVFDDFVPAELAALAGVDAQLAQARQAAQTAEDRRADTEQQARETHRRAHALTAELRAAIRDRDGMLLDALQRAAAADQQVHAVLGSTSWRATAPLRRIAALLPAAPRRHARRALKAAWWLLTPTRLPQRLRFLRERKAAIARSHPIPPEAANLAASALPGSCSPYARWINESERRSDAVQLPASDRPLVSFLIHATEETLSRTLGSIQRQPHGAWEIVLCRSRTLHGERAARIDRWARTDPRITIAHACDHGRASCLQAGLEAARGRFVAVVDGGDLLAPHALNELAVALGRLPDADILYSDEDMQDGAHARTAPFFKPGWSPELLYAFNYFGRLTLLRRELVLAAGGIDPAAGAAVEWDLHLRVSDLAQQIQRVPKVLCHRGPDNHRDRPAASTQAAADHRVAIAKYWRRHGFEAVAETQGDGTQRAMWPLANMPLVSIVIPTRDKAQLLRMCIDGLLTGTDYARKEIVIVDTGSVEAETLAYYRELAAFAEVRIVRFEKPFNYSAACNYGASCARGELLLFLNNDIEVVARDWLREMVRYALRPGVGCVGAKLVFPSLELQHAGVGIGPHLCALMYRSGGGQPWGVFGSPDHPRNWLAIMGACQLVRRDAFERVGGFDESYLIAMSDVALCLRIWRAGYRIAYAAHAPLVHHEGATRGNTNPAEDMRRIADNIRALGIDEDPYLHPELDGSLAIPALRVDGAPGARHVLQGHIDEQGSFPVHPAELDLCDDGACLESAGLPRESVLWPPQAAHRVHDKWSAARWCLDLLRTRADLCLRFPDALSGGVEGGFAQWLMDEGHERFGLPESFAETVRQLFSEDIAAGARQLFLFREDVRAQMPHGLTPAGRHELFRWFMQHGRREAGLRLEEVWWLFWQAAEKPAQELLSAYRFAPAWQRLYPDALTVFGRQAFAAWFAATYRAKGDWTDPARWPLALAPASQLRLAYHAREHWRSRHPAALHNTGKALAFIEWLQSDESLQLPEVRAWCSTLDKAAVAAALVEPGVNVIGHFCYPSGLRVSVEAVAEGLRRVGVETSLRDLRTDPKDDPQRLQFDGLEEHDITVLHTQPEPYFRDIYHRADLAERPRRGNYRIAYWYWEFDSIPETWLAPATRIDEVWTATEFIAKGLRERLSIPVRTLFPGVELGRYSRREREYFGIERGKFSFLFTFHMMSVMERKNPLGLIRAFKQAFRADENVQLVLKTSFGDRHPAQMQALREAAAGANIKVIDAVYSPDEVLSLMDACDAYVSLHRSEGLGLTLAEAMLMGKPVIATEFSGNLDFMDASNSLLVPCKRVKLGRPIPPYDADSEWAEPSIEHAAQLMRRVYEDPKWAGEIGRRGKKDAQAKLSLEAAGQRIAQRLAEIKAQWRGASVVAG